MKIAHSLNPVHWRARYVLWVTWLGCAAAIWWGIDTISLQRKMDAKATELSEEFEREEKILSKEGRGFADQFFDDLVEGRLEEAWSKYGKFAQKPEARQDLEQIVKYLSAKPKLTRPRVTLRTGSVHFAFWSGSNHNRKPRIVCSFQNTDDVPVPLYVDYSIIVENGQPRVEQCGFMAMIYRAGKTQGAD